jgi:hypothetical protein
MRDLLRMPTLSVSSPRPSSPRHLRHPTKRDPRSAHGERRPTPARCAGCVPRASAADRIPRASPHAAARRAEPRRVGPPNAPASRAVRLLPAAETKEGRPFGSTLFRLCPRQESNLRPLVPETLIEPRRGVAIAEIPLITRGAGSPGSFRIVSGCCQIVVTWLARYRLDLESDQLVCDDLGRGPDRFRSRRPSHG